MSRIGPTGRPPMAPPDVPRLFVAVPIPPEIVAKVGDLVADVDASIRSTGHRVRWVQMEGLHVTVRFLGPTSGSQIDAVAAAVDRSAPAVGGPFPIRIGGAGAFPDSTRPRALWLGIRFGGEALATLSNALTTELVADGWSLEARPFQPHLTIARPDGSPSMVSVIGAGG
ncbi:MAG: RNA 2',3'-cyclic phosphodiesterase, partial [Chloroflexi bacterium]|nr:RNA 2',3'-cyclic phosphodiesterase [Chloroflexota bacterium]